MLSHFSSLKFVAVLLLFVGFSAGEAFSQKAPVKQPQRQQVQPVDPETVTDAELQTFSEVAQKLQGIQKNFQSNIQSIVQESGIEMQRFQKIMMSQRRPQMAKQVTVTEEEKKIMKEIQPKLVKEQMGMQEDMRKHIEDSELELKRFRQIAVTLRQSDTLSQRLQEISNNG